jgi:hypothetical protein
MLGGSITSLGTFVLSYLKAIGVQEFFEVKIFIYLHIIE